MWFLTVLGLMWSWPAMSALSRPFAISFRTSISRSESCVWICSAISGSGLDARTCWRTFAAIVGEIASELHDGNKDLKAEELALVSRRLAAAGAELTDLRARLSTLRAAAAKAA